MTIGNVAYLAMCIASLGAFAAVVMWATHLTNPAKKTKQVKSELHGLDTEAWRALAR